MREIYKCLKCGEKYLRTKNLYLCPFCGENPDPCKGCMLENYCSEESKDTCKWLNPTAKKDESTLRERVEKVVEEDAKKPCDHDWHIAQGNVYVCKKCNTVRLFLPEKPVRHIVKVICNAVCECQCDTFMCDGTNREDCPAVKDAIEGIIDVIKTVTTPYNPNSEVEIHPYRIEQGVYRRIKDEIRGYRAEY